MTHPAPRQLLLLLALTLLALAAAFDAPEAQAQKSRVAVRVEEAKMQDYGDTISLTGEIAARVSTTLSFRVSGRIVERRVDVGDHVEPGEVLARVDPREQEADLNAARAALDAANVRLRLAASAFERQQSLLDEGFTTRVVFERAEEARRLAEGAVETAQAQLGQAQEALDNTVLRARAAGVITQRHAETGQVAQAAQPIFTLAEDGPRDAVFHAYESIFFNDFAPRPIALSLISDPSVTAEGQPREISPTIDPRSGTVRVLVGIEGDAKGMGLGAPVLGVAYIAPKPKVILPWSALDFRGGAPSVWVVDPDARTVSSRKVEVEKYVTGAVVLSGGVADGDLVVVEGRKFLSEGLAVDLAGEEAK